MKLPTDKLQCMELLLGLVAVVSDFVSVLLILASTVFFGKTYMVGNSF